VARLRRPRRDEFARIFTLTAISWQDAPLASPLPGIE
jgi:hypothetical protein